MIRSVYNNCKNTIDEVNIPLGRIYTNFEMGLLTCRVIYFFLFLEDAKKTPQKTKTKKPRNYTI